MVFLLYCRQFYKEKYNLMLSEGTVLHTVSRVNLTRDRLYSYSIVSLVPISGSQTLSIESFDQMVVLIAIKGALEFVSGRTNST